MHKLSYKVKPPVFIFSYLRLYVRWRCLILLSLSLAGFFANSYVALARENNIEAQDKLKQQNMAANNKAKEGLIGENETPYDPMVLHLAEMLGALHFLDNLCPYQSQPNIKNEQMAELVPWRSFMQQLIRAEHISPQRTARFYEAFNHSYRAYAYSYKNCSPMARYAQNFYRQKAAKLTQILLRRYGSLANR